MTEQLEVAPQHRVLEIGTGSGYQAAVLSRLAREVVSIERYRTLGRCGPRAAQDARLRQRHHSSPATALPGAPEQAPLTASSSPPPPKSIPEALVEQLAEGGKMVLPLGPRNGTQYIVKLTKTADGTLAREDLIAVRFVPLLPGQAREL